MLGGCITAEIGTIPSQVWWKTPSSRLIECHRNPARSAPIDASCDVSGIPLKHNYSMASNSLMVNNPWTRAASNAEALSETSSLR